ncbi:MAG TPA: glycosyltransferase family 25 protein [Micropepsaceae bacterium]|nr:glycosyltransferase family 25 protein [Micropepsaceae bacterium]
MTGGSVPSYRGAYINLDRSPLRRQRMEAQLAAYKLPDCYGRFSAVDGAQLNLSRSRIGAGETGAFLSHAGVLEQARGTGVPIHILEDDALLSEHMRGVIEEAIAARIFERFDILFTDALLAPHLGMLKGLKAIFDGVALPAARPLRLADLREIDLARENFSCLTSYVVGAASVDRVIGLLRDEIENGLARPADLFIRDCVAKGQLRAGALFPFVTSLRLDEIADSTIGAGAQSAKPSVMVLAVLRYLFFVGRDLDYAKTCLDAATKQNRRKTDPHHELMAQAMEFVLSADFQQF